MIIKLNKNKNLYILHRIKAIDISLAMKHLSIMLKSGIGLDKCLQVLADQSPDPKLQEIFNSVIEDIKKGISLSDSLSKFPKIFKPIMTSIIKVGEQGATLQTNLDFLSDYLKQNYEIERKIKGAALYPIIIVIMLLGELIGLIYFMLPKLQTLFSAFQEPPKLTIAIMNITSSIRNNAHWVLLALFVFSIIMNQFLKTKSGIAFKDKLLLKLPVINNIIKEQLLYSFARTLGILLQTGIPIGKALSITQKTISNTEYQRILKKVNIEVDNGQTVAQSLSKFPKFFPPIFTKIIQIGEETGSLEENLDYLYVYYSENVKEYSTNLTTLLEPILLIVVGIIVAVLALIIIVPIYQLTGSINE